MSTEGASENMEPKEEINNSEERALKEQVKEMIETCYDPEIPVNVYALGLIYDIQLLPLNKVYILMTLTSPNCPAAEHIPMEIKDRVLGIEQVEDVEVEITFDPPYSTEMMSEEAKLELGFL
jgi:FeS assembly SUF system protein